MNILYSILTWNTVPNAAYADYNKKTEVVFLTSKMVAIRNILMTGVPDDKKGFFAAVLCDLVQWTNFGTEIKQLDSNNTYVTAARPVDSEHSNQNYCFHTLIQPASVYKALRRYLDDDIAGIMNKYSFLDYMAAGCLQLLREINK